MDRNKTYKKEILAVGLALPTLMASALLQQAKENEKYENIPMIDKKVTFVANTIFYEDPECQKPQQMTKRTEYISANAYNRFEGEYDVTSVIYLYNGVLYEISSVDEELNAINNGAELKILKVNNGGTEEYAQRENVIGIIFPKTKKLV